jgi:hypothetical protein
MFRFDRYLPFFVFGLLSLLVVFPFLERGYILSLDMVFGPNTGFYDVFYGIRPVHGELLLFFLFEALCAVVPMWAVQKLFIFLILFLSGVSAYHLCPGNTVGKIFAGLIYVLNPFVYVRFLAGHFLLLLGYAVLPFAVKAFIDFFDMPSKNSFMKAVFLFTLVSVFSAHMMALMFTVLLFMLLFKTVSLRRDVCSAKRLLVFFCWINRLFRGLELLLAYSNFNWCPLWHWQHGGGRCVCFCNTASPLL